MAETLLSTQNLGIAFGGLQALSNLNLNVSAGSLTAMIGPNGAGKTTAFNLLTGIYQPSAGSITLAGTSLQGKKPQQIAALGLARTFQNIRLFKSLSVLDNVLVATHHRGRRSMLESILRLGRAPADETAALALAEKALDMVGLGARRFDLATSLPYGQQRRLELARALATGAKLLLLDEPAAGMNDAEKVELMHLIRHLRDQLGVAILLIEHDMRLVMGISEWVTVLDHGVVIAAGTPAQVRENPRVIDAYLGKGDDE